MRKLVLFFLLALNLPAVAQWGAGGTIFYWSKQGSAVQRDSVRFIAGTGATLTQSGNTLTIASTPAAGSVDSLNIVNLSVAATDLVNGSVLYAKLGTGVIDSVKAKDAGLINADLRVSTLDSSRIAPSGVTQSDVRVSAFDSSRVAPNGLTQSDIRVSALDSSRIAPSGLTQSDIRVSALDSSRVVPNGLTQSDIRVSTLDSSRIAPSGIIQSDIRISTLDSSRIAPSGLTQLDIRVSTLDSSRIVPSGLTQTDIRVSTLDSSRVAPSGLTQADIRVSALDSSRIAPSGLTQSDVRVSAFDSSRIAPSSLTTGDYRNSSISAAKILKSDAFSWTGAHTHTAFISAPDLLEFLGGALKETPTTGASDTTANYLPMKAFSVNDTATFDIFLSKRFASLDSIVVYAYANTATSAVVFNCGVKQTAVGDAIAGAFNAAATKTISTGTAGTLRQWSMTSFGSLTASTPSMLRGKIYRTAGGTGGDIFVNRVLIYGVGLR